MHCVYNLPICGGFCAPTESPEKSFLKHFSNEYTVPASGVFMKCGPLLETNVCCRRCGGIGLACGRAHRKGVMVTAFGVSFVAWILTIFAACGLSLNPYILKRAAWARATLDLNDTGTKFHTALGLNGRVDTMDCSSSSESAELCAHIFNRTLFREIEVGSGIYERVVSWEHERSCISAEYIAERHAEASATWGFMREESFSGKACSECRNTALASVSFVIMSVITQIPQMTTDLQRSTRFGDVNCQATMGALTSFFGTYSSLASLGTFTHFCWRNLPDWASSYPYSWDLGLGFICLVIATLLKLWDAFTHLLVPTPRCRHIKPPSGIGLVDYMRMSMGDDGSECSDYEEVHEDDDESDTDSIQSTSR